MFREAPSQTTQSHHDQRAILTAHAAKQDQSRPTASAIDTRITADPTPVSMSRRGWRRRRRKGA